MQTEKLFDTYSVDYESKFNANPVAIYQRQCVHQFLESIIDSGQTILDVGCGPGSDFEFYKNKNLNVTAIDISPGMIDSAREKSQSVGLKVDLNNIAFEKFQPEKKFEFIIFNFGVINTFSNLDNVFNKLKQLIVNDGIIIIVTMPPFHLFTIVSQIFHFQFKSIYIRLFLKRARLESGFEFFYYSKNDLKRIFNVNRKHNLCFILPTPDQYSNRKLLQKYFKIMWKIDKQLGKIAPAFFGGDHILFEISAK